jgi:hypothetical protein
MANSIYNYNYIIKIHILHITLNEFYNIRRHVMKNFNVFNNPSTYVFIYDFLMFSKSLQMIKTDRNISDL